MPKAETQQIFISEFDRTQILDLRDVDLPFEEISNRAIRSLDTVVRCVRHSSRKTEHEEQEVQDAVQES